jgi:outer membrane biosynthesis protein TonB
MKLNRWILVSPSGERLKSYQTIESQGLILLNHQSQKIILSPILDKELLNQRKELSLIGTFENGKSTILNKGFTLRSAKAGEEIIPMTYYSEDEEESKKPLVGYFKKSALGHIATLLTLILITSLVKTNKTEVQPPKVTLVEIKKEIILPPVNKIKPETKKIIQKVLPVKPVNRSQVVKTLDKASVKTPAILQGLKQAQNSYVKTNQLIKSLSPNSQSHGGGGTLGANLGGTTSRIGTTGMRSAQKGGGSLGSNSSSGYGKYAGGAPASNGLQIVSNQRAFSLPSGPDDNFSASGLDRDQIMAVINRHRGEITYCYEQALKRDPSLHGKVSIQFVISPSGKVSKATVAESNTNSAPLEGCMIARLRSWQFPKPVGAVNVDVLYPFHLTKLGQR